MNIELGKVIKKLLLDNANLTAIHSKIFPLISQENTTFPFVVYKRNSSSFEYIKERYNRQQISVYEVVLATSTYAESIRLVKEMINSFSLKSGDIEGCNVIDIKIIDADEDYIDDTFVQRLTLNIITK